ncbi:MAG: hypothetical protein NWE93_09865 [Candidatus Bathyarchaeota archaeon]|nr:hypothetical protein [Candidatus Bathyarchaeota archaeon]
MQKTKLFTITLLAALLVCSAFSFAAAQEEIPPATPNPDATVNPDETINPDGARTMDNQTSSSDNTTQDGTSTDDNTTDTTGQEPILYGGEIYANGLAEDDTAKDNTGLYITIVGAVAAIAVGGAIGAVYYRKHAKAQN